MAIVKPRKWRTQFTDHNPLDYSLACKDPSKAKQAEKNLYNPNFIIRQYWRDGDKTVFSRRRGIYADISDLGSMSSFADVQSRMDMVNEAFLTIPAIEREKFGNNPMRWLDFANNPANLKWMQDYGFLPKADGDVSDSKKSDGIPEKSGDVG